MKTPNYFLIAIITLLFSVNYGISQQITVNSNVSLQELIEDNFINSNCIEISNVVSNVNGNTFNLPSYATFSRGASNFPFENGIILSTGNAESAGNSIITEQLNEGNAAWRGDADLEAAVGITNTVNATSIEFDFLSASNTLQFNYLFASEEYDDENACNSNDSFVFLIREASSAGPYQNIAVIPNTTTPISVSNIRNEINPIECPAQNNQYFEGNNFGDTNYHGRTTSLTAATNITPYTLYHIKLVIADHPDSDLDSAVFLEANSFNTLDLGDDITTCSNTVTLDTGITTPGAVFEWYRDNNLINGATSNTLVNITTNGTYRVVVTLPLNSGTCEESDEIIVTLNTDEAFGGTVSLFELCDDSSDGLGVGVETFNLTTKDAEIEANSPFTNSNITYHTTEALARAINTTGITTISNNITSTIWVRVADVDSNCNSYTSFDLTVHPQPMVITPTNLSVCDNDPFVENGTTPEDGFTSIDLSQKDGEITGNNTDLEVSYYLTEQDARDGIVDPLNKNFYINRNTPVDEVYARVISNNGCVAAAPVRLTIDITTGPLVNRIDPQYIDACDADRDGFAIFELNEVVDNIIIGNPSNFDITFYDNFDDATEGNTNLISNPSNYTNTVVNDDGFGEQIIYLRVVDINNLDACASIVPFEIHTNLLLTGTNLDEFALCDNDEDPTNQVTIPLVDVETYISGDLPDPVTVTFHETPEDRDNGTGALPKSASTPYAVSGNTTLYLTLNDGNCSDIGEIILRVNPILIFQPVNRVSYCDTDEDGIGVTVDLHTLDAIVTGGNSNFSVTYFLINSDSSETEIETLVNTQRIETINARIASTVPGVPCNTETTFEIEIFPAPATTKPNNISICDNNISPDLDQVINEVVIDRNNLNFDFYTTYEAAEEGNPDISNTNWIPNTDWVDYVPDETQELFLRIENLAEGINCTPFAIQSFFVYVNSLPIIDPTTEIVVCKDVGSTDPPIQLQDYDEQLLNGQTNKEVLYALDGDFTSPMAKDQDIQSFNGTIFVRIQNTTDSNCFAELEVPVIISTNPVYDTSITSTLVGCSEDDSGTYIFNLDDKAEQIQQTSPDILDITFHEILINGNENSNSPDFNETPIANTSSYSGTDEQKLVIRIEKQGSGCSIPEVLNLIILSKPRIIDVIPYTLCDQDNMPYDNSTTFDLTTIYDASNHDNPNNNFVIDDRFKDDLTIHYFRNESDINENDGLDNTNAIPSNQLSQYVTGTTRIYIKIANTITTCFTVVPFDLIVNPLPTFNALSIVPECFNASNTYNLSSLNEDIVDDTSLVNISYHNSENGAEMNNDVIQNDIFNYTSTGDYTIWARIEDNTTLCDIATSFTLRINPNPTANTPQDLYECDTNYVDDDAVAFRLRDVDMDILGTQSASDYSITYHASMAHAEEGFPVLSPSSHDAFNGDVIYARIRNNTSNCTSLTQFNVFINPLPVVPLEESIPLCNDAPIIISAETDITGDTYLWSTGATTPEITILPSQVGDFFVTITRTYPDGSVCTSPPHNFTIFPSETAIIDFTPTANFTDPNTITVILDPTRIGDYVFILDDGEPQNSNFFENVTIGPHTITVRDKNDCMDVSKDVFVFDIPKFVTPNNDGAFDTWHVVGANMLQKALIYVHDRHGKLLKTLTNTSSGWDGTYNGNPMPADDYWYTAEIIDEFGNPVNLKGHFALKR